MNEMSIILIIKDMKDIDYQGRVGVEGVEIEKTKWLEMIKIHFECLNEYKNILNFFEIGNF